MELRIHAKLSKEAAAQIRKEFGHRSLLDLLHWAQLQPKDDLIPGVIADVIVQDEFTHDVVIPWRNLFLVYGTT